MHHHSDSIRFEFQSKIKIHNTERDSVHVLFPSKYQWKRSSHTIETRLRTKWQFVTTFPCRILLIWYDIFVYISTTIFIGFPSLYIRLDRDEIANECEHTSYRTFSIHPPYYSIDGIFGWNECLSNNKIRYLHMRTWKTLFTVQIVPCSIYQTSLTI